VSFCSLKKGITPKICILRFDLINSGFLYIYIFNLLCVWILFWNASSYSCFGILVGIQSCTLCLLPNSAFRICDLLIYPTSHCCTLLTRTIQLYCPTHCITSQVIVWHSCFALYAVSKHKKVKNNNNDNNKHAYLL